MVCNYRFWDTKLSDDVVEDGSGSGFNVISISWHGIFPFCEVVDDHDNVMMDYYRGRLECHEIYAPFCKWTNCDDRMKWSRRCVYFPRENLAGVTLFDGLNAIFKD